MGRNRMESIPGKNSSKRKLERKETDEDLGKNKTFWSKVELETISLMISLLFVKYVTKPSMCPLVWWFCQILYIPKLINFLETKAFKI